MQLKDSYTFLLHGGGSSRGNMGQRWDRKSTKSELEAAGRVGKDETGDFRGEQTFSCWQAFHGKLWSLGGLVSLSWL